MRQALMIPGGVRPAGPYSHAVVAGGMVFVSGQGPADPATGRVPDGFAAQVEQTMRNVQTILEGAGASLRDVVKVGVYLSDLTRFAEYNAIYQRFFPESPPARTTVGCQLLGILVEIDCIAVLPEAGLPEAAIVKTEALDTPVPVIDLDRVEHNLAKMQAYADQHGLRLRPHIKTHKLPMFAHRQTALGAVGITCQKLGEAEVMAEAGLDDIFISYPLIGAAKAERLAALAGQVATLRVAADSALAVETAARAAALSGRTVGVLIEFDSGGRRTGVVSVDQALTLARLVRDSTGLRFDGLMTYPASAATAAFVAAAAPVLAASNLAPAIVSGGGTPGAWRAHEIAGMTELRVGTYIYHDRTTVALGAAEAGECALHVLATVVSRPEHDRAVIDAGSKTLSSDLLPAGLGVGYGTLPDYPGVVIERLNEEHGMLDLSACATRRPELGEVVRILPNHVCVVSNLHDAVVLARGGMVVEAVPVAARGRTR